MKGSKIMLWNIFAFLVLGSIFTNYFLKLNLPIFKLLLGIFLVFIGLGVVLSAFGVNSQWFIGKRVKTSHIFVMASGDFQLKDNGHNNRDFTNVFSKANLDLSDINSDEIIKVSNVFGRIKITIPPGYDVLVKSNIVFGKVIVLGNKLGSFGDFEYKTNRNYKKVINLKVESVFGEVVIN